MPNRTPARSTIIASAAMALLLAGVAQAQAGADLKVSPNGRFLVRNDGTPFFYLADTAWELFHRLDHDQADRYLQDRAARGFTVIQAVVLAENAGLQGPNPNGDLPLIDEDLDRPNEPYFQHVDYIVDRAAALGLYVGMLPSWGSHVGAGEAVNKSNARRYGRYLGKRYADKPIIWILGGDRNGGDNAPIWDELAAGLGEGDGGRGLITYHPCGGRSSSQWFHDRDWLDFNMTQSGHDTRNVNVSLIQTDYALSPPKPTLDAEPSYEYPADAMPRHLRVGSRHVRRNAYWPVFSGAAGHTYGAHPIWQFYAPPREPKWDVITPWHQALDLPGASQMAHLKALMLSRPYLGRIPDPSILQTPQQSGTGYVAATRDGTMGASDATYVMVYFPRRMKVTLNVGAIAGKQVRGWWFDPRTGLAGQSWEFENPGAMEFEPPAEGPDWVLVLDDAARAYQPPGQVQGEDSKP